MSLRENAKAIFTNVPEPTAREWKQWQAASAALSAQARAIFALVEPHDWKAPIDGFVPTDTDLLDLAYAIEFFTATRPTFTPVEGGWHVTAAGYAAGPAGDH